MVVFSQIDKELTFGSFQTYLDDYLYIQEAHHGKVLSTRNGPCNTIGIGVILFTK